MHTRNGRADRHLGPVRRRGRHPKPNRAPDARLGRTVLVGQPGVRQAAEVAFDQAGAAVLARHNDGLQRGELAPGREVEQEQVQGGQHERLRDALALQERQQARGIALRAGGRTSVPPAQTPRCGSSARLPAARRVRRRIPESRQTSDFGGSAAPVVGVEPADIRPLPGAVIAYAGGAPGALRRTSCGQKRTSLGAIHTQVRGASDDTPDEERAARHYATPAIIARVAATAA
jgi:hypothetical protein